MFNEAVQMVWFRDVGIYNLRAIPTPIGFFSFRELLFIGLGAAATVAGVALFWGNLAGELVSAVPVGFAFYFAKKRIKMLPPEMSLLASIFAGEEKKSNRRQDYRRQSKKKEDAFQQRNDAMQITFSEKRPVPAQLNLRVPFTGKDAKSIVLFLDGQEVEGTKTSPSRIDDLGAHYVLNFVPDATDVGGHKAQIRFVGSTVPIQEFELEVRSDIVTVG